jgi:molybdenum ABC transporter molybdate-binding protein
MIKVGVITASDKGSRGEREDLSGPVIKEMLSVIGGEVVAYCVVADEQKLLEDKIKEYADSQKLDLVFTTGNVDAGLVYRSDAMVGKNIKVAAIAPDSSHKPIVYPVAILNNSQNQEEIKKFADFLFSDQAASIYQKYGFKPLSK